MSKAIKGKANRDMYRRSGEVIVLGRNPLVAFLYQLMRDGHLSPGDAERIVRENESVTDCAYTNGWLAQFAKDLAGRLITGILADD